MTPPRLPQWIMDRCLDPSLSDAVIGDLDEIFAVEARTVPRRARLRYWRRTAGALWQLRPGRPAAGGHTAGDGVMTTTLRDLVRGSRLFLKQPAFAWAAVVTLALAIGANTLIFSIANLLVVKPLPFHDPDRLSWILVTMPGASTDRAGVSLPEYAAFRDDVTAFTRLAAWRRQPATLRERSQAERVLAQRVIGDLQGVWGLGAVRGRPLSGADEQRGAPRVVTLSHRFWQTRFGGDQSVLGRSVSIDGAPHTIVGVVTPEIELGNVAEIDIWVPHSEDPRLGPPAERGWRPVGRLREGATKGEVDAQVASIAARIARDEPALHRDWSVRVGTTRQAMGGANTWLILALLAVVVGLLLLLACANVMNLLIARLIGRRQELAVRTALGASRSQVVRQIVTESLLLGIAGGLLGMAIAWSGLQAVRAVAIEPIFRQLVIDGRVFAFAALLSFATPLLFSILPTLRALRDDVRTTLSEGSTRSVGSLATTRGRSGLVVLQVTLAVTLLIVAGLMVQSVQSIIETDLGYDQSRLAVATIDVAGWQVPREEDALQLRQRVVTRVREMTGVDGVALATEIPALDFAARVSFDIDGRAASDEHQRPRAGLTVVTADYFEVTGIPVLAGRGFERADTGSNAAVAVVSAEAARRYWPSATAAIGSAIRILEAQRPPLDAAIIGVARDTANPDLDLGPEPMLFLLDDHHPARETTLLVRSSNPGALVPSLQAAVAEISPDLPAYQVRTLLEAMEEEFSSSRLLGGMFAAFAVIAILLATAGLYGVMSYAVSQRSGEIAVRIALGAPSRSIARQVVGQSVKLAVVGVALGVVGAYAIARAVASVLFGVTPSDPKTYVAAVVLTLVAALVATWLPMRRAATIDPVESLRRT
jgi:putative ABC transport system permease protein